MRYLFASAIVSLLSLACIANNVVISNMNVINNGPGNIQMQFDLSWDNSWRTNIGQANYDGVWVFFKYRGIDSLWNQITMTGSNNVIPGGFDVYQGSEIQKTGAMLYRNASNMGTGSVTLTAVRLGLISTLPYDIDVKGFGVEMVYIPIPTARPFYGDGDGSVESLNAFHYTDNTATTTSVIPIMADANAYDDAELTTDGIYAYDNDTIQLVNPLSALLPFPTMKALWCMKYEISQAGYRDFLNTLTLVQQTSRTANSPTSAIGTQALTPLGGYNYRNVIKVMTPSTGGRPAAYGCDATGDNIFDQSNDGEWVACNYLNWPDVAAYLDWSGLAPLSELQYERICRGTSSAGQQPAVYGEYAWGTNSLYSLQYTLSTAATASEIITTNTGTLGNAVWTPTAASIPYLGPLRNGIFATANSNRISSGSSFYGVMEMTGNVSEYCITLGTVAGRSAKYLPNGNGSISTNGNAKLPVGGAGFWPGMEGNSTSSNINTCSGTCEVTGIAGIVTRGGSLLSSPASTMAIAYRSNVQPALTRNAGLGGRGVLYIR